MVIRRKRHYMQITANGRHSKMPLHLVHQDISMAGTSLIKRCIVEWCDCTGNFHARSAQYYM